MENSVPTDYELILSRRKTIGLTFERDSRLVVRAPEGTTSAQIQAVLDRKALWLYRQRRRSAATAALIVPMSLQPVIPGRGALQQSPPPLRRPSSFCNRNARSPRSFQRTATCPFFTCLNRGVQCTVSRYPGI